MMDKILRINVSSSDGPTAVYEPLGRYAGLGGRAMVAKVICEEIPANCHPLGPDNKLVLAPGVFCGLPGLTAERLFLGCKSPLTGKFRIASVAAAAAVCLSRLGIAAVILEGNPATKDLYCISVVENEIGIAAVNSLRMLTNYELAQKLKPVYGEKVAVVSIGTAGEMRMASATIAFTDPELRPTRHAGRGGIGAVMGSKGIKSIILDPKGTTPREPADPDLFQKARTSFFEGLRRHPLTGGKRLTYGTNILNRGLWEKGEHTRPDFRQSVFSGQTARDDAGRPPTRDLQPGPYEIFPHPCQCGIPVDCSCLFSDAKPEAGCADGEDRAFGQAATAGSLAFWIDNYGFDSIEMGVSLGLAMEAGLIASGDGDGALRLVHEAGKGSPLGRILGAGAASMAKAYGLDDISAADGLVHFLHETYVPRGMDFAKEIVARGMEQCAFEPVANLLHDGAVPGLFKPEAGAELPGNLNVAMAAMDSLGCCLLIAFVILDQPETFQALTEMVAGVCGREVSIEDILELGNEVLKMERDVNAQETVGAHRGQFARGVSGGSCSSGARSGDVPTPERHKVLHV